MANAISQSNGPVVGIIGATGHLGKYITEAFLAPDIRQQFSKIILLSRQSSNSTAHHTTLKIEGALVRTYNETSLASALVDIDILINAASSSAHDLKHQIISALSQTKISVYIPSEFGVDHTIHDFSHPEWDAKKAHAVRAQDSVPGIKISRVYCGLFLEDSIVPFFGFDKENGKYEAIGSADSKASFTSLTDIGKAVARLATLPKDQIPDHVHIAGDNVSVNQIADIMSKAGAGKIDVEEVDLESYKRQALEEPGRPAKALRFLVGEGKIYHSTEGFGNDNELVNPRGKYWKWKKMKALAEETGGKPNSRYERA